MNLALTQLIRRIAVASIALASIASVHAATFSFTSGSNGLVETSKTFGSTPSGLTTTVTANSWGLNQWQGGKVGQYNGYGLGVTNSPTDDSHTIDSSGWTDYIMFSFSQAVDVNSISIGYVLNGSDSQFSYWVSNSNNWAASNWSNLGTGTLSGSTSGSTGTFNINAADTFAQYLIVAANGSDGDRRDPNDSGFKISSLNVTTRGVPDNGSILTLIGISMVGLVAFRRRFVR